MCVAAQMAAGQDSSVDLPDTKHEAEKSGGSQEASRGEDSLIADRESIRNIDGKILSFKRIADTEKPRRHLLLFRYGPVSKPANQVDTPA